VSTIEAANTVRLSVEAKGDQDMLHLLLGINDMDLVASAVKYHKTCFASYASKSNLKSRAFKDKAGQESAYDKSFLEIYWLARKKGHLWFKLHQSEIEASHKKSFR